MPRRAKDLIYHYVFGNRKVVWLQYKFKEDGRPVNRHVCDVYPTARRSHQRWERNPPCQPQRSMTLLSGVCRQLYEETALIPFQSHIWNFNAELSRKSNGTLYNFLWLERKPSRAQVEAISTILVAELPGKNILEVLPGLRRVFVEDFEKYRTDFDVEVGLRDYVKLKDIWRYDIVDGENGPEYQFTGVITF